VAISYSNAELGIAALSLAMTVWYYANFSSCLILKTIKAQIIYHEPSMVSIPVF